MSYKNSLRTIVLALLLFISKMSFAVDNNSVTLSAQRDTIISRLNQALSENSNDSVAGRDSLLLSDRKVIAPATDSSNNSLKESILPSQDTVFNDTIPSQSDTVPRVKSTLEMPAFSTAKDSIIEDFSDGKKMLYYYGDVSVKYGNIEIKSDYMAYDLNTNTVFAAGTKDSVTNEWIGLPVMTEGSQSYTMENVTYNFKSSKAKITNMITQDNEGILHGNNIKKMEDNSLNIQNGKYTVCDHEHPHYYLKMTVAKVMTEPEQRTIFGPAYLVLADVPLPIGLPFGFVPKMPERASGILMPTFGEETSRGLYMKDAGFYFVFGNHFDVALTGSIYTLGSWNAKLNSRYKKKYAFDGNISLTYSVDKSGEKDSPDYSESSNFAVSWSHSQDSKARPGTSFRASVNFASPSNNKYNSDNIQQALQNQMSSSISYSKTWTGMSMSVNASHSQNSRDSSYAITFPNITFTVNRFFPFKRKNGVGSEKFYEKISLSYNSSMQNKINFKVKELKDMNIMDRLQNGMTHNFAIGLPSFTILNYIQAAPSISYGMNWYFREQTKRYDPETNQVITEMTPQFSRFGISQTYSAGISFSTRIYGLFNFGKDKKVQAIRHMISPQLGINLKPELGTYMNGYRTYTYIDKDGKEKSVEYNKYAGNLTSPPGRGRNAGLTFSVGNNIEAKISNPKDSTGKGFNKIKLIDQLNLSGSYNFLADSLKLSTISINASTTVFGKIALSGNLTLDPYAINERGRPINTLNIVKTGKLARLTNASASLSYSINGEGAIKGNDGSSSGSSSGSSGGYTRVYYHPVTGEYIPGGWVYYMNPNIPWSLSFNLNYSFSRNYQYLNERLHVKDNHLQTLSVSGQVRITPSFNLNLNTGFDLSKMKMTTTNLSATYDLHCFNISVSWVPNGQWESWSFRIAANASALADLLQFKKSSSFWDN